MGRKAGWEQPVSQRGAEVPATPATPFAAAQTQLSAFAASVLAPEPLCPPLTGALSFTAATVACSWSPSSSLHCGGRDCPELPPQAPSRRAGPHGGRREAPPVVPAAGQAPRQQWEGRGAQRLSSAAPCWCFEEQQGARGPEAGRGPSRLPRPAALGPLGQACHLHRALLRACSPGLCPDPPGSGKAAQGQQA